MPSWLWRWLLWRIHKEGPNSKPYIMLSRSWRRFCGEILERRWQIFTSNTTVIDMARGCLSSSPLYFVVYLSIERTICFLCSAELLCVIWLLIYSRLLWMDDLLIFALSTNLVLLLLSQDCCHHCCCCCCANQVQVKTRGNSLIAWHEKSKWFLSRINLTQYEERAWRNPGSQCVYKIVLVRSSLYWRFYGYY